MSSELTVLTTAAASIGFVHSILGPDHYLPFVVMAKARNWNLGKTTLITTLCGIGHVLSSVLIGLAGIALGLALANLETIETIRGEIAAWGLIAFGLLYGVWGLRRAYRNRPHQHWHAHEDLAHTHKHTHQEEHLHLHESSGRLTPWVLFIIFAFGPCESLIPLLMYPAAQHSLSGTLWVATVFGIATIGTMLVTVLSLSLGIKKVSLGPLERFSHALAGIAIAISGMAIKFLGL
ncbi:MAG: hypothetical protein A2142_00640 [candidate division Zixibacteria bacterium RBG_16_48_11]|nr:MAG: hypothetical protein A2142_00640 [candidate division Zixibacteria bacterium RBG_16_48_11]